MMPWYPVQRQRFPDSPSRISRRSDAGWSRGTRRPTRRSPACRSRTAARGGRGTPACSGDSAPSGAGMPSMVVTSAPSACTANIRQERTASPSTQHRAGAADAVLAAEVGAGEVAPLAQEVGEGEARLDRGRAGRAVHRHGHGNLSHACLLARGGPGPRDHHGADVAAVVGGARAGRTGPSPGRAVGEPADLLGVDARPTACPEGRGLGVRSPAAASIRGRAGRCAQRRTRSRPSSSRATVAPAMAKSPWRRASSSMAKPRRPIQTGR